MMSSITDISINHRFSISRGRQFRPVGAFLSGLGRPQPISEAHLRVPEVPNWLDFLHCLTLYQFLQKETKIGVTSILKPTPLTCPQFFILSTLDALLIQNLSIFELMLL
jgi:hypothetical protein